MVATSARRSGLLNPSSVMSASAAVIARTIVPTKVP
jgi:hypothetical protein